MTEEGVFASRDGDAGDLPAFHSAPQEVAFDPAGHTTVVAWAASDDLAVFDH